MNVIEPEICARCSRIFGSCCTAEEGDNIHHTVVSGDEASVILAAAGLDDEDALMREPNDEVFIKRIGCIFPDRLEDVVSAFPLNKLHTCLSMDCFGRCTLLGKQGCVLADEKKPLFCQIYPFWFINDVLVTFRNERCLALSEATDINEQMKLFNTDEKKLRKIYKDIITSWLG